MSRNVEADYYKKTSDDRVPVKWMVGGMYSVIELQFNLV